MKNIFFIIISLFLTMFLSLIYYGCAPKKNEAENKQNCLTDLMEKTMTTSKVVSATVENELRLTGKVTFDEEKVIKVYPVISGTVTEVRVGIGDHVEKGQVIAVIKSSEMAGIENDVNTAQSDYEIALKNYAAATDMYKSGIASEKEYITSQKELQKAKSVLDKATNISNVYGGNGKTDFFVKAPITGVIVNKTINTNMQIRTDYSDNLFTISDLKNIWVMANVFETDISKVQQNYVVKVTTLSYPDEIIKGKVNKIYDVLDPVSKAMKARIKIENKNYQLKPGMFANVILHYAENIKKLTIPSKAVIFDNSKNYVVVYKSKCDMELRGVTIYKSVNEITYIDSGLKEDEKIIVNNNLLIYDQLTD